jgi:tRNA G18 (ribose-2'-O)-methylase SpoU
MKIAVLDNLRSVHNVGSIFRTANAAGIDSIILCGTTPTPLDAKGNRRSDFAKVSLGAENTVSWSYHESAVLAVTSLQNSHYYIVALEQSDQSVDYKSVDLRTYPDTAVIIGNEVDGIADDVVSLCNVVAEIPMLGTKESLNVTIAFGIGVYAMYRL